VGALSDVVGPVEHAAKTTDRQSTNVSKATRIIVHLTIWFAMVATPPHKWFGAHRIGNIDLNNGRSLTTGSGQDLA
jgi:hypothetical protein